MHHIGIVVNDINKSINDYLKNYGLKQATDVILVKNQGVRVVLLSCESDVFVELIEPIDKESPAYTAMRRGGGLNHICYETEDFAATLVKFKNKIVRKPRPSPNNLFQGRKTFFIYRDHQLIEFLET